MTIKEKNKEQRKLMGRIVMHDLKEFKQVLIQGEGKETKVLYEAVSNDKSRIYKYIIQNIGKGEILKKDATIILSQKPLPLENIDLNKLNSYRKEFFYDDVNSTTQKSEIVLKKVEKKSQTSYQARGGDNFENCIAYTYIIYDIATGATILETLLFIDCDEPGANDPREDEFDDDDENGNGGGGNINAGCVQGLQEVQTFLSNTGTATSEDVSSSENYIDPITKQKIKTWTSVNGVGWSLESTEVGTVKYYNSSNQWGWTNFSHQSVVPIGINIGGSVIVNTHTATPAVAMGGSAPCTYQIMNLYVAYTLKPKDIPCVPDILQIPPVNRSVTSVSPTWNANN